MSVYSCLVPADRLRGRKRAKGRNEAGQKKQLNSASFLSQHNLITLLWYLGFSFLTLSLTFRDLFSSPPSSSLRHFHHLPQRLFTFYSPPSSLSVCIQTQGPTQLLNRPKYCLSSTPGPPLPSSPLTNQPPASASYSGIFSPRPPSRHNGSDSRVREPRFRL